MANKAKFHVPDNNILVELGRLQILHSHLDHTLRLTIKRMINISIDDPGYWNETRGMTKDLRNKARKKIKENYKNDEYISGILNQALDEAEEVTGFRNQLFHSVWMKAEGEEPKLHDRDLANSSHESYPVPTPEKILACSQKIQIILNIINSITRRTQ